MKKFLTGCLLVLCSSCLFSQNNDYHPQWFLGAKGGVSASKISFTPAIGQDFLIGNSYGIIARYMSEKHVGLQMELTYEEKGWKETTTSYQRQLDYIAFPFLTHISMGNGVGKFFVNLGPQIGYLWKEAASGLPQGSSDVQYNSIQNNFDYGITGALGTEFHTKAGVYQLEARYYYGIGNLFSNGATDYFSTSSNQNISVHLAILFGL